MTSAWQTIETAPRDGRWFVICRAGEPDWCEVGRYHLLTFPDYVPAGDGLFRKEEKVLWEWDGFNNFNRATHWQELLQPPELAP